jgi:hypothetical protein
VRRPFQKIPDLRTALRLRLTVPLVKPGHGGPTATSIHGIGHEHLIRISYL